MAAPGWDSHFDIVPSVRAQFIAFALDSAAPATVAA
jgi:hypothetical protein